MRGSLRAVVEDVLDHGMKGTPSRARRQLLGRDVKPPVGFTLPWAGAAAPAPAVRRRENLRSASFRDYAMEEPATNALSLAKCLPLRAGRAQNRGSRQARRITPSRIARTNPMAENRKRKFWGWGYEDQGLTPEQQKNLAERMAKRFGLGPLELTPAPKESELNLRAPRVKPPAALEAICSTSARDRAGHTYGKSSRDLRRAFRRDYPNPIDVVAFPDDENELIGVL